MLYVILLIFNFFFTFSYGVFVFEGMLLYCVKYKTKMSKFLHRAFNSFNACSKNIKKYSDVQT